MHSHLACQHEEWAKHGEPESGAPDFRSTELAHAPSRQPCKQRCPKANKGISDVPDTQCKEEPSKCDFHIAVMSDGKCLWMGRCERLTSRPWVLLLLEHRNRQARRHKCYARTYIEPSNYSRFLAQPR